MMNDSFIQKLKWDTDFWGVNIYNLRNINEFDIQTFLYSNKDKLLIQALVCENEISLIEGITDVRFNFCESKVTLIKDVLSVKELEDKYFKKIQIFELENIKNDFFELFGKNSRYSIFGKEKINEFYYTWVINSIVGKMNDECYGYYIDNDLAGFITFSYKDYNLSIGLVGVLPKFQKRGVAQKMLDFVNNIAFKKKLTKISVSTQGKNVTALNVYIKNGYLMENIKYWYYFFN
jgi:dTDP-4-amino-4,6-dideoxy-D-galactose acyltransferase